MCVRAKTTHSDFKEIRVPHVKELGEDLVFRARDKSQLVILVVKSDRITIVLVVSFSNHFQLCSDFKSAECLASIPIHESCDIGVKEVLPSLCSLFFHNRKCQFVISENKDERRLFQIVGQN